MLDPRWTVVCSRDHSWCVEEICRPSVDGSEARFHLGVPAIIPAGDDVVTCRVVSSEEPGTQTYIEVELALASGAPFGVWLSGAEARRLQAELDARSRSL